MAKTHNRIVLIGYVGSEPEFKGSPNGKWFRAKVSMATNHWDGAKRCEVADWHTLIFWNQLAERVKQEIHTGSLLTVVGSLEYYTYERDGIERKIAQIIVDEFTVETGRYGKTSTDKEKADKAAIAYGVSGYDPRLASDRPQEESVIYELNKLKAAITEDDVEF